MINCYSPYSGRQEVCYIKGSSGIFYRGVRVENVSYPLSISAIQSAICSCLANGDKPVSYHRNGEASDLTESWVLEFELDESHPDFEPNPNQIFYPLISNVSDIEGMLKTMIGQAVCPNSGFPVTALLETDKGFIPGVNVEPKAWSLGLCAERVAVSRAVSAGIMTFRAIHIFAPKADFVSPCGACRQVLSEFMPNGRTELYHGDGTLSKHIVTDLLPYGLTTNQLKK